MTEHEQRPEAEAPETAIDGAGEQPAPEVSPTAGNGDGTAPPAAASPPSDHEPGEAAQAAELVERELEELRAKAAQRDEYLALAQRTQADFENYRKRMTREIQVAQERGVRKVVQELLPGLDNLERALAAVEAKEAPDSQDHVTKGVRMVQAELRAALGRIGIEPLDPRGEPFDPTWHEAMATQPVEGAESGTVVEVLQQGYQLNGGVIRPARVVVAA